MECVACGRASWACASLVYGPLRSRCSVKQASEPFTFVLMTSVARHTSLNTHRALCDHYEHHLTVYHDHNDHF